MVVDDDADIRSALGICLKCEGFDVELYADGREAMDRIQAGEAPHAIVLDLMMPRMNGFEVIEALKAEQRWARIPVVVISANRGYSREDMGVRAVLRKPFELDSLISTLDQIAHEPAASAP
jgi:CheY-like chemotaxis protein